MTVINNATLILKDKQGNEGVVKSFTDNDINKISNAITDVGQVVDPATHMPIEATATTVGVVQLADDEAIAAGTTGRVVDAKQLQDAVMGVTPANCVTNVAAGSTANKIKVTKDDYTTTITIDNVEHADSANSVQWDNVQGKPSSFTPNYHTHDDRYYTESEIDTKLSDKANATDLSNYLPLRGGNVTGNLTVQNKSVVRSVNGVNADASGNVSIPFIPDYTSAISISQNDYVVPQDGWINFETSGMGGTYFARYLSINNVFVGAITYQNDNIISAINVMVKKGDLVSVWLPDGVTKSFFGNLKFYPFKVVS